MKSIGYYSDNGTVYPIILQSSNRKIRFDIIKANTEGAYEISRRGRYSPTSILSSIQYTSSTTKVLNYYGPSKIINTICSMLNKDELTGFLLGCVIPSKEIGTSEVYAISNCDAGGASNLAKSLSYTKADGNLSLLALENINDVSTRTNIKSLNYFVERKDLKLNTKDYRCLDTYDKVTAYAESVDWSTIEYTSQDTETTGLRFFRLGKNDRIVGMSHSYKDKQGVYIPFFYKGVAMLDPTKVFDILKPALTTPLQIWQNGSFDYRVWKSVGVTQRLDRELTVLMHLTNPIKYYKKELKPYAKKLLNEDTIELDEILGTNFDANLVPYIDLDLMTIYACGDTDYTLRVFKILLKRLKSFTRELFEWDHYNYQYVAEADWFGIPIKEDRMKALYENVEKDKLRIEDTIFDFVKKEVTAKVIRETLISLKHSYKNLTDEQYELLASNSEIQYKVSQMLVGSRSSRLEISYARDKAKIFYDLLDYPKLRYTEGGMLSTGSDYYKDIDVYRTKESTEIFKEDLMSFDGEDVLLAAFEVNCRVFPLGYMYKQLAKYNTQLVVYRRLLDNSCDGWTFSPCKYNGTETGRISNQIQTIPKYAKGVIGFPENSNYGIMGYDCDQVELRGVNNEAIRLWDHMKELNPDKDNPENIFNIYSYRPIVDLYNSFESDPHTEMCSAITGIPKIDVTPATRSRSKAVNFGVVYGATAATSARDELPKAKTEQDRSNVIKLYENMRSRLFNTQLHLQNYVNYAKEQGLYTISEEEIPPNMDITEVGRTMTRSGRPRLYDLTDLSSRMYRHIENMSRNHPIQGYCRDVVFKMNQDLHREVRRAGYKMETILPIIFVHDEFQWIYDKRVVNPLWLLAMVYKYCCIEIAGSPIRYYATPSVVNDWGEAKSVDKYDVPKDFMATLSQNLSDYELVTTMNHRDYVYSKVKEFCLNKLYAMCESLAINKTIELTQLNLEVYYNFFGKLSNYYEDSYKIVEHRLLNKVANALLLLKERLIEDGYSVTFNGTEIDFSQYHKAVAEPTGIEEQHLSIGDKIEDQQLNFMFTEDDDDLFDSLELQDSDSVSRTSEFSVIDSTSAMRTVLNRKCVEELNKQFATNVQEDTTFIMNNVYYEEFQGRAVINLDPINDTYISVVDKEKVEKLLMAFKDKIGPTKVYIQWLSELQDFNIHLPSDFLYEKFDKYISSLRRSYDWKNAK